MTTIRTPFCAAVLWLATPGCTNVHQPTSTASSAPAGPTSLAARVDALGNGLQFLNSPPPDGAEAPEEGADFVYARTFSANSRNSPVGIELWVYDKDGKPLHIAHKDYLEQVYNDIYGWSPSQWTEQLGESEQRPEVLTEKSDFFWESLAQHLAERVFNNKTTPAMYRFNPTCVNPTAAHCEDGGIEEASRVVVRTFLDARRDPMNPVTRSITYIANRGQLADPELFFELQVPNGIHVAGPHQETLDFRPRIAGSQNAIGDIRIWAHIPAGNRTRTSNFDYPDYNLIFVPLRHLVLQGEVDDPKQPATGNDYDDSSALLSRTETVINSIRTPEGGQQIADQLQPFLSTKYYYMFDEGGQGITGYRDYILGTGAGVARGLNPDFGRIEVLIDGDPAAVFERSEQP